MSYQVLARKWRPKNFQTLSGQEHVLKALINALDKQRLHHAYLFTGTRGVGKTTIARTLAKCLNCETGISSLPCGKCDACLEIDTGNFIDLIEVDAASRTRVEDTRELLDNVQYAPSRGRFKIYLIDEVHMLSTHSFNALLKTLEEPPEHVKFLLATTDPQKLPATVLSRCLQFHLKNLSVNNICSYLQHILQKEDILFEEQAILQIAQAANGSMRDALSILDQAIAFNAGKITTADTQTMLGTIEQNHIEDLLQALAEQNAKKLLDITNKLTEISADFNHALEKLISLFHQIAVIQLVPEIYDEQQTELTTIKNLSQLFSKEDVQLYYQIALTGRRDLPLASDSRSGFEMTLLRMIAFRPAQEPYQPSQKTQSKQPQTKTPTPAKPNHNKTSPNHNQQNTNSDALDWINILPKLQLSGMCFALAANCSLKNYIKDKIDLILDEKHAALLNEKLLKRLNENLNQFFGKTIKLTIQVGRTDIETPAKQQQNQTLKQQQAAVKHIENDPIVQSLIENFDATVNSELITSISDKK